MATKDEILQYIRILAEQKAVTREELELAFDAGSGGVKTDVVLTKKLGIAEILYYIGGAIVCLGIGILLAQNWSTLGFGTKVLATLGSGVAAYFVGLLFSRDERTETVGSAFYLISALVSPVGLYVVLDNAGFDAGSYGSQSLIFGVMLGTYVLSLLVFRKTVFVLFSILFGSCLFFSFTSYMIGGSYFNGWEFSEYRVLSMGVTYILLGYAFSKDERVSLSGFLYGFGILGVLGATLALGKWEPNQNIFWELIYPGLIFATLFTSVQIKSKAFLTWGSIFLMLYILKITSEYFSSGLGWPLSLVIAGLAMIGVGYMSISLKHKYLNGQP